MRDKIIVLLIFLMMVASVNATVTFDDVYIEPEFPELDDNVDVCADINTDSPPIGSIFLEWDDGAGNSGTLTMYETSPGSGTYCRELSAGTISPSDGTDLTVNVNASDGNSSFLTAAPDISYDGAAPIADLSAGEDYECEEGETIILDAQESYDSNYVTPTDELRFTWDLDNDNIFEIDTGNGNATLFTCVNDGDYTVAVLVMDNVDNSANDTSTVTVSNVDPVVTTHANETAAENTELTLADIVFTDAGTSDTHTVTIDWGDGGTVQDLGTKTSAISGLTHTYNGTGNFEVTVTVTDNDLGEGIGTFWVAVSNAVPQVTVPTPDDVNEGEEFTLGDITFTDSTTAVETFNATVNWGDGTIDDVGVVTSPISGLTHTYVDEGSGDYDITVTISDGTDDGEGSSEIDVSNVDPELTVPEDTAGVEETDITLGDIIFTDVGTADTHNITIYWGDGEWSDLGDVTSPVVGEDHSYDDPGTFTVTIVVNDEDGGEDSVTLTIEVYDYSVDLVIGWNLISVPLVSENDDTSIETVLAGIAGNVVSVWSFQDGEWLYYNGSAGDTLTTIAPGYGYFLKMSDVDTFYQRGEKMYYENAPNTPTQPPSVQLTTGWTLIGHYGENEVSKDDAFATITGKYATLIDDDGAPVSTLIPGEAYWLFMTEAGEYAPSEASYCEIACGGPA